MTPEIADISAQVPASELQFDMSDPGGVRELSTA